MWKVNGHCVWYQTCSSTDKKTSAWSNCTKMERRQRLYLQLVKLHTHMLAWTHRCMHGCTHTCKYQQTHICIVLIVYVHIKDHLFLEYKTCLLPPFGRIGTQNCRRVSLLYNLWVHGVVVQLTQYRLQCIHMRGSIHRTLNEQQYNMVTVTYSAW